MAVEQSMRGCVVSVSAAEVDEGTWSANGDLMDTIGSSLGVTSELVSTVGDAVTHCSLS